MRKIVMLVVMGLILIGMLGFSTPAAAESYVSIPEAPSNLTVTAVGDNWIDLAWVDNSIDETGFLLDRKTEVDIEFSSICILPANAVGYKDTDGITPATTYYYRISSFNEAGSSPTSNVVSVTTSSPPSPIINRVYSFLSTSYYYNTSSDTFINSQVIGNRSWSSGLGNPADSTGQQINDATLTLDTTTQFDWTTPTPVVSGPPTYQWSFGNIPERYVVLDYKSASVGLNQDLIAFTPGFDLSRSVSQTRFTTSGVQTLNVTATARQVLPRLDIKVRVAEDAYVNPAIISPTTDAAHPIKLSDDGRELTIRINDPVVDIPYTYEVTIDIVLKQDITVDYMPRVSASWGDHLPTTPVAVASSFSHAEQGMGIWTWSAQGTYEWTWHEGTNRGVNLTNYTSLPQGTVSGRVVIAGTDTGIGNVRINVLDAISYQGNGSTYTQADGTYSINLPAGSYLIMARPSITGLAYVDKWYENVYFRSAATPVDVAVDVTTEDINFNLEPGSIISGFVRTESGAAISGAPVSAVPYLNDGIGSVGGFVMAISGLDGSYRLSAPLGDYTVTAFLPNYVRRYYNLKDYLAQADKVTLTEDGMSGVNFELKGGAGSISGHVYQNDGTTPIGEARVEIYVNDGNAWILAYRGRSLPDGSFSMVSMKPGEYRVTAWASGYMPEWYNESPLEVNATLVTVQENTDSDGVNFTLDSLSAEAGGPYLVQAGEPITLIGAAYDYPALPVAYDWDFGDGTSGSGKSVDHTYGVPGIYTATLTVTDVTGVQATDTTLVVVYDSSSGFVTGGGWIDSPLGAYTEDATMTGKATFGFVSKYQKGATIPTGQTEFRFKAASLNFHSESYDWLVIAGAKAQYKGTGTINGAGSYQFMLTAIDGSLLENGQGLDKFRIKIWNDSGLIYDNQLDSPDSEEPTTVIGGGSIVIHKN